MKAKTTLIRGDGDLPIPPVYARAWKKAISGASLTSVAETGYRVTVDHPVLVAGTIAGQG
ncbi:MAG: hypothetical protein HY859_17225 [Caulobacterales bacterium]|nr:hypothetical protein [Caulobacterales bacterium]